MKTANKPRIFMYLTTNTPVRLTGQFLFTLYTIHQPRQAKNCRQDGAIPLSTLPIDQLDIFRLPIPVEIHYPQIPKIIDGDYLQPVLGIKTQGVAHIINI
jgi:hypothetical protein